MYVSAIVLAAGRGLRFKSRISKPLIEINSKPVIIYSLHTLSGDPQIKDIILVTNLKNIKSLTRKIKQYHIGKIKKIVLGGKERRDSVINGLEVLNPKTALVLIHDGVRPFINKQTVSRVIREAKRCGAAILGVPVKATIKSVKVSKYQSIKDRLIVEKTLDRNNLWEIQTPQVFRKDLILAAYKKFGNINVTDDAMLVEKMGVKVSLILGSYNNIKITTPEDLVIAEAILKSRQSSVVCRKF